MKNSIRKIIGLSGVIALLAVSVQAVETTEKCGIPAGSARCLHCSFALRRKETLSKIYQGYTF